MSEFNEDVLDNGTVEVAEVPTEVVFTDANGVEYTLGFDRESAMKAEKLYDLSMSEAMSGKSVVIFELFSSAFIKHHPHIKPQTVRRLWDDIEGKDELYKTLVVMYGNTAGSLLEEPEKGKGIRWKTR